MVLTRFLMLFSFMFGAVLTVFWLLRTGFEPIQIPYGPEFFSGSIYNYLFQ